MAPTPKEALAKETALDKLGIGAAPIATVPALLDLLFSMDQKITLCLVGDTGIGKTPIVRQWAKQRDAYVHVMNFGHMTSEDVSMTMFSDDVSTYDFVPQRALVRLNEEAEKRGCAILFIDEFNRGDKTLVNSFFTLTDDRRIHDFHLHPNVLVVAAMNPSDGTYMVNQSERDHAIRKRLCFVYATADLASWLRFARSAGFHKLVVDFVQSMGQFFYDYGARDAGKAFACPSSWEKVSSMALAAEKLDLPLTSPTFRTLVEGQIGTTAASAFLEFVRDQSTVIQPDDILVDYAEKGRPRVAKLLGATLQGRKLVREASGAPVRTDVLTALNRSIAITLSSMMPDPVEVAPNLAAYLMDLPAELFQAFWAEHMKSEVGERPDVKAYTGALNSELKKVAGYAQHVRTSLETQRTFAREMGRSA